MLLISRKAGERIVIGSDIQVVVTEIKRRSVRIGVVGNPRILVLRGEVYESIEAANRAAVAAAPANEDAIDRLLARPASESSGKHACNTEEPTPLYDKYEKQRGDES
jgi:carbon storage regulator